VADPLLTLPPHAVQYLGMAIYELATKSAKYSALSTDLGRVSVNWQIVAGSASADDVVLVWQEVSPSTPAPRTSRNTGNGFGTTVLERVAPEAIGGIASLHRESGLVRWTLRAPLSGIGSSVT
jgi:two-component sensor histidine kinase